MSPLRREWGVNEANGNNNTASRPGELAPAKRHSGSVLGVQTAVRSRPGSILSYSQQPAGYYGQGGGLRVPHNDRTSELAIGATASYHQQNATALARMHRQSQRQLSIQNHHQQHYLSQPYLHDPRLNNSYPVTQHTIGQPTSNYPTGLPPPPYSTMPRYATNNMAPPTEPRRHYQPEFANRYDKAAFYQQPGFDYPTFTQPRPVTGFHNQQHHRSSLRYPTANGFLANGANSLYHQGDRGFDVHPADGFPQYNNDGPPSPQSIELEGLGKPEIKPPYLFDSFTRMELFIKIFAIASLLFPPTGIGAVVCAFTANKESSPRYRAARHKVALILASVGFTAMLFIAVVVIIATQVVH